jgi:UDP-N-acetylmuramyl pentapeptide phosphotransferase/UDP-N-acetylglucosamine-1-phosphate transferase
MGICPSFMGDIGSLSLGGLSAVLLKKSFIRIVGGIFVLKLYL